MKWYRILTIFFCVSLSSHALASVSISEIMYDVSGSDTGREWVEFYNNSDSAVDISGWKFLESPSASNHALSQVQGVVNIPAGGYGVVVSDPTKFLLDYPSFSGNLFKASFSTLNNTSGTVLIKDSSSVIQDQASYLNTQGASGDGNSLQNTSTGWVSGVPTPGQPGSSQISATSSATTISESADTNSTQEPTAEKSSAHSSPTQLSDLNPKLDFQIYAGRDRLTTVGNTVTFQAVVTKIQGISERDINFFWSFGDGSTYNGSIVNHTYRFPGEYVVVLNGTFSDKQAVGRLVVKVISPDVSITIIPNGIEIWNKSKSEINLEGWSLVSKLKTFTFPKDTLIPSGKKVDFSEFVTEIIDNYIELKNPIGTVVVTTKPAVIDSKTNTSQTIEDIQSRLSVLQKNIGELKNSTTTSSVKKVIESKREIGLTRATTSKVLENTASTVTVFEAKKQDSFITKVLILPIKGFSLIKRLFVED